MRRASRSRIVRATILCVLHVIVLRSAVQLLSAAPQITTTLLSCDAPANAIVAENCLPGATDLNLATANDLSIQGFADGISVNTGQTVQFKIKTDATSFRMDIYRLGYYGGAGARKIVTSNFTQAQPQPDCLSDATTGLVDCANWAVSASWDTRGQTSGIYLAKLTRTDGIGAGASHIPFIVRDDARASDLLFQTSDTTWQAYNRFGGVSLYCGGPQSNTGSDYSCPTRGVKVSYNRPFDTRDHDPQSWLFNAEYPMLRWLEANGYDVSYFTGVDADASPALIKRHKVYLSVGHDEYWSANQRANVEAARDAGVNLAFFSGNEVFWKTRWEPSLDGVTSRRTLVSYKETLNDAKIDPSPEWTGTWRDPRFSPPADGGRPENALTGTIWTVNCCTYAITVPAEMGALRFWRNTGFDTLAPGTSATLTSDTLGYEWDEDLDNGSRPGGLLRLSSTIVDVPEKVTDYGAHVGAGTATHSLTLYRKNTVDPQGTHSALVFGAGTVQWSWGLDSVHDRGTSIPDPAIRQATVNLFADMNAQPGTIQSGLVAASPSTDTDAPVATVTSPADGATVEQGVRVTISGTAADVGGRVAGVEVSLDGGTIWHGAKGRTNWTYEWLPQATGQTVIKSRATDDSGNVGAASASIAVNVGPSNCPCTSLWNHDTTVPAVIDGGDATAQEIGVKFTSDIAGFITGVRFYKSSSNTGTHIGNLWSATGSLLASATFSSESATGWQQVRFNTPVAINAHTTYVASYHTNVGHYAANTSYFVSAAVDSPPLHAPAGTNGVFAVGASAFPGSSFHATNYWVDVDFAESVADANAPVISNINATAIDGSTAVISWRTNEDADSRVEYSTNALLPPAGTLSVANGAFVTQHTITLTGLTPYATYWFRLTSLDHAANAAVSLAPSFTVPGPTLHDTSTLDFSAGTPEMACDGNGANCVAKTYVAETSDGEVMIAPAAGAEFSGASLPSGWIGAILGAGGSFNVLGGNLVVDGAQVGTCDANAAAGCDTGNYGPGHTLEFGATFTGDPFQHAGLGVTFGNPPWAIFSTGGGGAFFARTNSGFGSFDTALDVGLLGSPHRYRIDWTASSVTYSVDGLQVASHAAGIAGPMRPIAASDLNAFGGNIVVNWIRMSPYLPSAYFLSRVFDAASQVSWHSVYWTGTTPPGTSLSISVRTGNTPTPDGSWTAFQRIAAPGAFSALSQYIQYRADLATADPSVTPQLEDIIVSTDQAPSAVNDTATTALNTPYTFAATGATSLKANDSDADTPFAQLRVIAISQPANGFATLNANGSVTYTPAAGFSGADAFTYTITDGLLKASATASITVGSTPPVANDDGSSGSPAYTVNEDTVLSVAANASVTANDVSNGGALTAVLVTNASHGTVSLNADGSFTYTSFPDAFGPDSFTYRVQDASGLVSNVATVFISVAAVNDPPSFTRGANQIVAEDSGPQAVPGWATAISAGPGESGQTLNFIVGNGGPALFAAQPAISGAGTLTYTPAANAAGTALVTVQLHDDGGTALAGIDTSAPQTFTITITAVNDAPVANAQAVATTEDTAMPITLAASDVDGDALTYSVVVGPAHGTLSGTPPAVTYTPAANYNGPDSFTFKANDGALDSNIATVTITVTPANDAPVASAKSITTYQEMPTAITLSATDVDGNTLTYSVVAGPAHGTLSGTAPNLTYKSAANYTGPDSFTFKANDGIVDSNVATVSITVTAINLTATLSAPKQVRLTWSDGATNPSGYTLQRATNAGFTTGLTSFTIAVNTTTFTDTTVAVKTTYFYRVRAVSATPTATSASGTSAFSNTASILVLGNTNGLVMALNFNEAAGSVAADSIFSGNGNSGTIAGALHVGGVFGNALSFNGTNALVTVASNASFALTSGMTLEAWVKPTTLSTSGWTTVVMKERTTTGLSYALYANDGAKNPSRPAGYARIGFIDQEVAATPALPLNAWTHVAVTYDGATMRLYVGGVLRASRAQTGSIVTSTEPLRIGGNMAFASEYFAGLIDEVRVYNRALTPTEITVDMATPIP